MSKTFCIVFCIIMFVGCRDDRFDYEKPEVHEGDYFSYLCINNMTNNNLENVSIDTYIYYFEGYEKISYSFDTISIGQKTEYIIVFIGQYITTPNAILSKYLQAMRINYFIGNNEISFTVFDEGESVNTYHSDRDYLRENTYNTIVIRDDGIELIRD